ncbi:MAG TPA: hypothetical protein VHL08_03770 [Dongiaceae bacterium]|nr:hypothetical protein [Dongiaceae bacterium]
MIRNFLPRQGAAVVAIIEMLLWLTGGCRALDISDAGHLDPTCFSDNSETPRLEQAFAENILLARLDDVAPTERLQDSGWNNEAS